MDLNYDELVEKFAMGRIDIDEAAIPLVLEEARKRRDGNVIAHAGVEMRACGLVHETRL
ncbi:MAG: hypothetical protein IJ173_09595 [Kiritimatiellae bacterium]|nr:hypothetical protein [Kiritimatiellia bacterium]